MNTTLAIIGGILLLLLLIGGGWTLYNRFYGKKGVEAADVTGETTGY